VCAFVVKAPTGKADGLQLRGELSMRSSGLTHVYCLIVHAEEWRLTKALAKHDPFGGPFSRRLSRYFGLIADAWHDVWG
jgi:hypothetical protein